MSQPTRSVPDSENAIDAFLAKLGPTGKEIDYETALGGAGDDEANGVAVDSTGNAYITGNTRSTNFPTTSGAFQVSSAANGGDNHAFVAKLNASGNALVYSTYFGGNNVD